jgi:glucose-6-phosphate-specific signal transduction histidine kinase
MKIQELILKKNIETGMAHHQLTENSLQVWNVFKIQTSHVGETPNVTFWVITQHVLFARYKHFGGI